MTEAGWTREKPTAHGWYFYKDKDGFIDVVAVRRVDSYGGPNLHEVVITVEKTTAVYQKNLHSKVSDLDGEWLGPLTPDSYQQGRVAGLRECKHGLDIAMDEGPLKAALYRWIDARAERLEREAQLAQAAQDEKEVRNDWTRIRRCSE